MYVKVTLQENYEAQIASVPKLLSTCHLRWESEVFKKSSEALQGRWDRHFSQTTPLNSSWLGIQEGYLKVSPGLQHWWAEF